MKTKENEKRDKYLDLAGELKKATEHEMVTVIPVVNGALGMVPKRLLKRMEELEIEGRVENIQIIALLRAARISRRVLKI